MLGRRFFAFAFALASVVPFAILACGSDGDGSATSGDGGGAGSESSTGTEGGGPGGNGAALCASGLHVDTAFGTLGVRTLATATSGYTRWLGGTSRGLLRATANTNGTDVIERLHDDGSVDPTWSSAAFFTSEAGVRQSALAVMRDGSVLVGWRSENAPAVARLGPDGQLDTSFGNGGITLLPLDRGDAGANVGFDVVRFAERDDGAIYVVGNVTVTFQNLPADVYVARLSKTGAVDTSFGKNGATVLTLPYYNVAFGAVPTTSGGLVLGVDSMDQAIGAPSKELDSLFRFGPDGLVDPSYGSSPDAGLTLQKEYDDERVQLAPFGADTMLLGGLGAPIKKMLPAGDFDLAFGVLGAIPYSVPLDDDSGANAQLEHPFVLVGRTIVALVRAYGGANDSTRFIQTYDEKGAPCGPRVTLPLKVDYNDNVQLGIFSDGSIAVLHQPYGSGVEERLVRVTSAP
jgi:uncharacterized delta-60 repeat protein